MLLLGMGIHLKIWAQGPPIIADKAIMLGSKRAVLRNLTEFRNTAQGQFVRSQLMGHYLPTADLLFAVHLPWVHVKSDALEQFEGGYLGDIQLKGKFQFFRKDQTGKTLRAAIIVIENLPTGPKINVPRISLGEFSSYQAVVLGYESIKYGISNELGYEWTPNLGDELQYKLGFGLPLLRPKYPLRQINLYFEYMNIWGVESGAFELLYAQGIQYARGPATFDLAVQAPLVQDVPEQAKQFVSLFVGMRYIF